MRYDLSQASYNEEIQWFLIFFHNTCHAIVLYFCYFCKTSAQVQSGISHTIMSLKQNVHISIVSPVYKAELIVDELVKRITEQLIKITDNYEIILVEDCGPDNSWKKIEEQCKKDSHIVGIKLSRNFGQHHAITAGLDHCRGEWVIVMDCDLQDRPEEIPNLYNKAIEGYDIVFARRAHRQDGFLKKTTSSLFTKCFTWLSGTKPDNSIGNFGIYNRKVILAVNKMREPMRSFNPMVSWVGFNSTAIDVVHAGRFEGRSSYNYAKLIKLAIDIALAYSDKPLRLTIKLGFSISAITLLFIIFNIYKYVTGQISQPGYASIILSIWLLSGIIIFVLGIIGLYISKIFEGIKDRPLYIIKDIIIDQKIQ